MQNYTLYVGSNNKTNQLELAKIKRIVSGNHEGFTVYQATGYWLGKPEQTAVISISDDPAKVKATIQQLKTELHQDAIAYQVMPALRFS